MDKITISAYEFMQRFPDERTARHHIERIRWEGRPVCPHCQETRRIQVRKVEGPFRCGVCKTDFTVRTGTIFERSHVPLDKWLYAIYLVVTSRKGISSLQLSKEIGVTQKTAWFMLQRIRTACGQEDDDGPGGFLAGIAESDETYIGGKEANKHEAKKRKAGRGTVGKTPVLGLRGRGGKVKATVLSGTTVAEIQSVVRKTLAPGSTLCTDEHAAYRGYGRVSSPRRESQRQGVRGRHGAHQRHRERMCGAEARLLRDLPPVQHEAPATLYRRVLLPPERRELQDSHTGPDRFAPHKNGRKTNDL